MFIKGLNALLSIAMATNMDLMRRGKGSLLNISKLARKSNEPRREKTGLRGFRPGPTQIGLYKLRKELEA